MTPFPAPRLAARRAGLSVLLLLPVAGWAQGFSDDFSSGAGSWTTYSPLTAFGAPATASVASGALNISVAGSPAPTLVGPGRGGSFRMDQTFTDFSVSYDVTGWGATPSFAGAFARTKEVGLGTLDGYAMGLDFSVNRLFISRIENESVKQVVAVSESIALDPSKAYHLVFNGIGANFTGQLYDKAGGNLLYSIAGSDDVLTSGVMGLGLAVQSADPGVGAAVTFDNVVATVPEPSPLALLGLGAASLAVLRRARRG